MTWMDVRRVLAAFFFLIIAGESLVRAAEPQSLFRQYNPDIDKYAFTKSFVMSLGYYSRLKARLATEEAIGNKFEKDLKAVQTFIDDRTLDNSELRVARNYLTKYSSSKNLLIRRVAYDAVSAYADNLVISARERQLWQVYLRFKKTGIPADLDMPQFRLQMENLARGRKSAGMVLLGAVQMLQKVILSADACPDEDCRQLVLTQGQRDKLVEKLNGFSGDNMAWGVKAGQGTFEAAVASLREVLEDSAYLSRR